MSEMRVAMRLSTCSPSTSTTASSDSFTACARRKHPCVLSYSAARTQCIGIVAGRRVGHAAHFADGIVGGDGAHGVLQPVAQHTRPRAHPAHQKDQTRICVCVCAPQSRHGSARVQRTRCASARRAGRPARAASCAQPLPAPVRVRGSSKAAARARESRRARGRPSQVWPSC